MPLTAAPWSQRDEILNTIVAKKGGFSERVQRNSGANERLERLRVDLVALVEIDRAPGVAFQARVEQARRVCQRRALGEGHLHSALVDLTRADDPVVRPHGNPGARGFRPLPFLDHFGVGFLDDRADPGERLTPPVVQLVDPRVDPLGGGSGFLWKALRHDAGCRGAPPAASEGLSGVRQQNGP